MRLLDLSKTNDMLESINTARQLADVCKRIENEGICQRVTNEVQARHNAKLEAGAEASVAQKELMDAQLTELKSQKDILTQQLHAEQAQRQVLEEHLKVTTAQNDVLSANYQKLEEMYNAQIEAESAARVDLHKSRVFNAWMMVIAIIAMLAAVVSPIITILVSR